MSNHPYLVIIAIGLIMLLDFFVALAKSVFEHVNRNALEESENPRAAEALRFTDKCERFFFNGCWLIRGFAWLGTGSLSVLLLLGLWRDKLSEWNIPAGAGLILAIVVVTVYVIVLITYIIPDRLGNRNTEDKFFKMFGIIRFVTTVFKPLSSLLEIGCAGILKPFGISLKDLEENVTEEEIISIVNEGQEQGILDDDEAEMISNIISFDEKQTKDIMTHRTKMIAVDSSMSVDEALQFMASEAFSRYPLYTGDIDNIVGVIHLKDVAKLMANDASEGRKLIDIARKPFFVPDTLSIDELFSQMQAKKTHMAVVIDEYGQTAGIVAMEDILEEIVGNIEDEFDDDEKMVIKAKDGSFVLRGEADLNEVIDASGIEVDEEDMETFATVNGLVISLLDRIPVDGERGSVVYKNYVFEILEAKNKMVRKCRLKVNPRGIS